MLSPRSKTEFVIRLRQNVPLHNNFVQVDEKKRRPLDDFFLYTSVSGLRFLHSRNPPWFQFISSIALVTSMLMSMYHSWTFVQKFLQPRHTAQLTAAYYSEVDFPSIIICQYKRFKMVNPTHTSDFAHVVAQLWKEPTPEPMIQNLTLGHFLNETLTKLEEFAGRKSFDDKTMKELDAWNKQLAFILPEIFRLINFTYIQDWSNSSIEFKTHNEFREWKAQLDDCYLEKFHISKKQFYTCRLSKVRQLLKQTIQNYRNLIVKIKKPPSIDGFVVGCNWWSGTLCIYKYVDTPFGIKCIKVSGHEPLKVPAPLAHIPTKITLDTRAFNNQVDSWESNELRVALLDERALMPDASDYYKAGGGMFLDLGINSLIDVYYKGLCRKDMDRTSYAFAGVDGPQEEACQYRYYEIDHSTTNFEVDQASQDFYELNLREKREKEWAEIDAFNEDRIFPNYESEIFTDVNPLFQDYFDGVVLLGQIFDGCCEFMTNRKPFPVNENCSESSLLSETRNKISTLMQDIYAYEENTSDPNSTIGFAHSAQGANHLLVTKFIRYYSNSTNIQVLGEFFNEIYQVMTKFRNSLNAGSVCSELTPHVQRFLTNNSMVQRTAFDSRQTMIEWRLSEILKRKDARLIYGDYVSQNFMTIRVRFRHLYGIIISQADEYNMFRLIADIGSAMGLYFGLSVLTIYEFCVFVFVKNAAEGVVPPPSRNNLYDDKEKKSEGDQNLNQIDVPPAPF